MYFCSAPVNSDYFGAAGAEKCGQTTEMGHPVPGPEKPPPRGHRVPGPQKYSEHTISTCFNRDDAYLKLYFNQAVQDELKCSYCRKTLCVGPIFFRNEDMNRSCGRCYDQTGLEEQTYKDGVLQDHLYERLLPHLAFECYNKTCPERLLSHHMKEHEKSCGTLPPDCKATGWIKLNETLYIIVPRAIELLEKLSCDKCTKLLTVFPVLSNGTRFICGRCAGPIWGSNYVPQKIYAIMAEYMHFPCTNRGCPELLLKAQVERHEKTCRFAETQCPLLCGKVARLFEMSLHVRSCHLDEATDRLQIKSQTVLCNVEGEPLIVAIEAIGEGEFSYTLHGLDAKEYDNLLMEIVNEHGACVGVAHFTPRVDASKDVVRVTSRRKNAFLRLAKLKFPGDQGIVCNRGLPVEQDLIDKLECNVCLCYMLGKIYKCENRHPICGYCRSRIRICPMCRGTMDAARYFDLEVAAQKIRFPCEFQEVNKCLVALPPKILRPHQFQCHVQGGVRSEKCSFARCNVEVYSLNYEYFYNHCAKHHRRLVMHQGNEETITWRNETCMKMSRHCKVLFFDGEVFFVLYKVGGGGDVGAPQGVDFRVMQRTGNGKKYNYTIEMDRYGRISKRKGTCNVHRPSKLGVDVNVDFLFVRRWLVKAPDHQYCCNRQTEYVLNYRVNLEVEEDNEYAKIENYRDPAEVFDHEDYIIDDFE